MYDSLRGKVALAGAAAQYAGARVRRCLAPMAKGCGRYGDHVLDLPRLRYVQPQRHAAARGFHNVYAAGSRAPRATNECLDLRRHVSVLRAADSGR